MRIMKSMIIQRNVIRKIKIIVKSLVIKTMIIANIKHSIIIWRLIVLVPIIKMCVFVMHVNSVVCDLWNASGYVIYLNNVNDTSTVFFGLFSANE